MLQRTIRSIDRCPTCEDPINRYVEAHPEIHLPPAPAQGTVPRWTSLSWTPFTVRHAPGAGEAANAVALAVHRAREILARRIGISMPVRVLVVDGADDGIRTLQPESTRTRSAPMRAW